MAQEQIDKEENTDKGLSLKDFFFRRQPLVCISSDFRFFLC
jgi:hypothetical protein